MFSLSSDLHKNRCVNHQKSNKEMHSFKVNPRLGSGFLKQSFRVYLKTVSNEAGLDLSQ